MKNKRTSYDFKYKMNPTLAKIFKKYLSITEEILLENLLMSWHKDGIELTVFGLTELKTERLQEMQNKMIED